MFIVYRCEWISTLFQFSGNAWPEFGYPEHTVEVYIYKIMILYSGSRAIRTVVGGFRSVAEWNKTVFILKIVLFHGYALFFALWFGSWIINALFCFTSFYLETETRRVSLIISRCNYVAIVETLIFRISLSGKSWKQLSFLEFWTHVLKNPLNVNCVFCDLFKEFSVNFH